MNYKDYTIEKSGMNFYVKDPSGHRAFGEVPATIETAKKWIDQDIAEKGKKASEVKTAAAGPYTLLEELQRNFQSGKLEDEHFLELVGHAFGHTKGADYIFGAAGETIVYALLGYASKHKTKEYVLATIKRLIAQALKENEDFRGLRGEELETHNLWMQKMEKTAMNKQAVAEELVKVAKLLEAALPHGKMVSKSDLYNDLRDGGKSPQESAEAVLDVFTNGTWAISDKETIKSAVRKIIQECEGEYKKTAGMKTAAFTKQHFIKLANIIRSTGVSRNEQFMKAICGMLEEDNPGFDEDRFMEACGARTGSKKTAAEVWDMIATDFPTQKAMDKYLHDHPDADRTKHHVVEEDYDAMTEHGGYAVEKGE